MKAQETKPDCAGDDFGSAWLSRQGIASVLYGAHSHEVEALGSAAEYFADKLANELSPGPSLVAFVDVLERLVPSLADTDDRLYMDRVVDVCGRFRPVAGLTLLLSLGESLARKIVNSRDTDGAEGLLARTEDDGKLLSVLHGLAEYFPVAVGDRNAPHLRSFRAFALLLESVTHYDGSLSAQFAAWHLVQIGELELSEPQWERHICEMPASVLVAAVSWLLEPIRVRSHKERLAALMAESYRCGRIGEFVNSVLRSGYAVAKHTWGLELTLASSPQADPGMGGGGVTLLHSPPGSPSHHFTGWSQWIKESDGLDAADVPSFTDLLEAKLTRARSWPGDGAQGAQGAQGA